MTNPTPSPFLARASAGTGYLPEAGVHHGRLLIVVDLGTQVESFKDRTSRMRKVLLGWELAHEKGPDGDPHVIGAVYSWTFTPQSNLRSMLKLWRGRDLAADADFDVVGLLGEPCLVTVEHRRAQGSDREFARVANVSAVPKGTTVPPLSRPPLWWHITSTTPIPDVSWMPFVFGEDIATVIGRCLEKGGDGRRQGRTGNGNGNGNGGGSGNGAAASNNDDVPY
jgi:hypothetical protein